MNTKLKVTIWQTFDMDRIIQVLSISSVNGKSYLLTEVNTTNEIFLTRCIRHSLCFRHDILWEF